MDLAWQAVMPLIIVLSLGGLFAVWFAVNSFKQKDKEGKAKIGYEILGWIFLFIALACFGVIGMLIYLAETIRLDPGPMF